VDASFRVSGSGFQVSGFRFQVSGSGFQVSSFGIQVSGFGSLVSGFGFQVSGFGFQVSGFEFRVSGFGFRVSGLRFRVSGFCGPATCPGTGRTARGGSLSPASRFSVFGGWGAGLHVGISETNCVPVFSELGSRQLLNPLSPRPIRRNSTGCTARGGSLSPA